MKISADMKLPFGLNLPNFITAARICLIPLFLLFILIPMKGGNLIATILFIIAAATDFLDGYYARKFHLVTNLGKFLDPLADKLLVISAFVCLVALGRAGAVAVIIIIARELAVTVLRAIAAGNGEVIAASMLGKAKTVTQMAALIYLLFAGTFTSWPVWLGVTLLWLAVAMTILSGADYILKCKPMLKQE